MSEQSRSASNLRGEYLVNTQPHARNGTYRIIVRDLNKNVIVQQLNGGQVSKPQTIQVLDNGHLVIGYSKVRPWRFDFVNDEGELYNSIDSDSDKCFVLKNGLLVEVIAKQTVVKQILPEFKAPRIVQVYEMAFVWIDLFDTDLLVAQSVSNGVSMLYVLHLSSSTPEITLPIYITNIQLYDHTLVGTTPQGDYVQRIHLHNVIQNGFTRTETTPIPIRKYKQNDIRLVSVNDRYTIYMNHQKHSMRDIGVSAYYLVDWKKRETIWHTSQDMTIVATSSDLTFAYFVYCDNETHSYHFMVCGSSLSIPIPLLTGLKAKGESRFMSNGTFVFHGEKRIIVLDIETSTVLAQYDVTRHVCDLMAVSKWNYKPKPKPIEMSLSEDVKGDEKHEVESEAKHITDIQAMVDTKTNEIMMADDTKEIPPPPPPSPEPSSWLPPPPPSLSTDILPPIETEIKTQSESKATQTEDVKPEEAMKIIVTPPTESVIPVVEVPKVVIVTPTPAVSAVSPPVAESSCTIM